MDNDLDNWRKQIDELDEKILDLLAKRMDVAVKIGSYKKGKNLPLLDKKRQNHVIELNISKAKSINLPEDFIKKLLFLIHRYSLKAQK